MCPAASFQSDCTKPEEKVGVRLPSKWKIKFLKPIYLPYKPSAADNSELMHEIAEDVREQIQEALRQELRARKKVYF